MSIYVNLAPLSHSSGATIPTPTVKPRVETLSPQVNSIPGVTVTLSDAARRLAKEEPNPFAAEIAARGTNAIISPDTNLRDLLKQYDFHNITPRQLAHLGNELFRRGEISVQANGHFFVADDLNEPMNPDKPIDVIAHFKFMNDALEKAVRVDSEGNWDYGIASMKHFTQTFDDIRSFVESGRKEISTHQGVTVKELDEIGQRMRLEAALVLLKHPPKTIIG